MKTVKDLIVELLDHPMDAEVFVEVNGDEEHVIEDVSVYGYGSKRLLLKIEIPEEEG
ncbi:hypothetical protein [Paenibacillus ginsengarvi]|uniref:hypothetical protein n=1 Tax=Paenibacillus ginsengarvi TaxID=400777 RepID=UPI0013152BBB|nr:hypothetical protein [Paenibacillus ginsengarvi]